MLLKPVYYHLSLEIVRLMLTRTYTVLDTLSYTCLNIFTFLLIDIDIDSCSTLSCFGNQAK